jgi:phage protein D
MSSSQESYSPRFEVTVGGQTFKEAGGNVTDLVVETTLDGADRFSMTLHAVFDREQNTFPGFSWDDFATGTKVDISLGWGDGSLEPLFVGKIHRYSTTFSPTSVSVGVSGYGLLHDMMQGKKDRSWSKTTVKDVVKEVLSSYFGTVTVEGGGMKRDKIYQHDQSDYRFVQHLADKYGYRFYTKRNAAFFTPRASMGGDPVATLRYGAALESFTGEVDEATAVQKVEVRHWDMQAEKEIVGTASTDATNKKKEVFRIPCSSSDEATTIAETKLAGLSQALAQAHGETDRGIPKLTAGETVSVGDVPSRFTKNYYVTKTTHRVSGSGYRTTFEAMETP